MVFMHIVIYMTCNLVAKNVEPWLLLISLSHKLFRNNIEDLNQVVKI